MRTKGVSTRWRERAKCIWREWVRPVAIVVVVLCTFRSAVADWHDVPTGSMKPTIVEGDRILVNKLAYDLRVPFTDVVLVRWSEPKRGEIVILFSPDEGTRLVKRVIAVPGDVVALVENRLVINGMPVAYEVPAPEVLASIDERVRRRMRVARERLGGADHFVMAVDGPARFRNFEPVVVPADKFFVMGDNRDNSRDSRFFGLVDRTAIVGRVGRVVFSIDRDRYYLPRLGRFLKALD